MTCKLACGILDNGLPVCRLAWQQLAASLSMANRNTAGGSWLKAMAYLCENRKPGVCGAQKYAEAWCAMTFQSGLQTLHLTCTSSFPSSIFIAILNGKLTLADDGVIEKVA